MTQISLIGSRSPDQDSRDLIVPPAIETNCVAMAPRQKDQGQFTVQAEVGPGDVTGVYHITFCNVSPNLHLSLAYQGLAR